MVRFSNLFSRMHAATKPQVLGLVMILLGIGLRVEDWHDLGLLLLVARVPADDGAGRGAHARTRRVPGRPDREDDQRVVDEPLFGVGRPAAARRRDGRPDDGELTPQVASVRVTLAQTERALLADLFDELGPDEPTRCEGWQTGDLLAHLLIRERRPDAVPGTYLSFAEPWTAKVAEGYKAMPWHEAVQLYRSGAPVWNPTRYGPIDAAANGGEMFIHHEDVRRGQPELGAPRVRRGDTAGPREDAWTASYVRRSVRKAGVGVVAALPDGRQIVLRKGEPTVVVTGEPGEVLIWASGRPAARVELTGSQQGIEALEARRPPGRRPDLDRVRPATVGSARGHRVARPRPDCCRRSASPGAIARNR